MRRPLPYGRKDGLDKIGWHYPMRRKCFWNVYVDILQRRHVRIREQDDSLV
jgi:hypothetical protein